MATRELNHVIRHLRAAASRSAGELSDAKLLEAFVTRFDEGAFAALVRRHGPMVLGVCRRVLKNPHDADDAFQAAFLVLVRRAACIGRRELLGNWLYGVAYRTALGTKAANARRRAKERQVGEVSQQKAAVQSDAGPDLQPLLDQELSRLPDRYRVPIVLCDLQGLTRRQAARQLGVPEGTLSGRLTTARRKLARRLAKQGVVLSGGAQAAALATGAPSAAVPTSLVASTTKMATAVAAGQGAAALVPPGIAAIAEGVMKSMLVSKLKLVTAALTLALTVGLLLAAWAFADDKAAPVREGPRLLRSARSGPWSAADTWEDGKVPAAGARVQIRKGHTVTYDLESTAAIRSIHIAGTMTFARDRNTLLEVGLIKIQPGDDASENGFDCDAHLPDLKPDEARPALEVGTANEPIPANVTATIRLRYFDGMDKESCPAIVCCGGRMDFHGAPLSRTWVKLGAAAKAESAEVALAEAVTGWRAGDRVIVTATVRQNKVKKTFKESTRDSTQTEERIIKAVDGTKLTVDKPLAHDHQYESNYRAEVANLSRNVVVESAPKGPRGHTMYHRNSAGSISYAEFRHLGKEGVLGRYSLHYHLCGDTLRGSYVIGASVWDSDNRWLTIHGTNSLVVRDCVGYQSKGHGFFFEDGTEVYNVLDRNLAVQAYTAKPLPKQAIPFDKNDGAGFWWANSLNTFTRNVACECDEYGYFFQAAKTDDFDPVLPVLQPDGTRKKVDIRTLPFVRFEDNESHCQRRHAFNLGGGVPFGKPNVDGVGPDEKHPFVIRNFRAWNVHWAIHPVSPSVLLDKLDIFNAEYGVWRPEYNRHAYHGLHFDQVPETNYYGFGGKAPNKDEDYPKPLDPVDDLPPVTVITHVLQMKDRLVVRGTTSDNGTVKQVSVNGQPAKAVARNFAQWEIVLEDVRPGTLRLVAKAEDEAGNVEKTPHKMLVSIAAPR